MGLAAGCSLALVPASEGALTVWALGFQFPLVWFSPWALFAFYTSLTPGTPRLVEKVRSITLWSGIGLTAIYILTAAAQPNIYPWLQACISIAFILLIIFSIIALITGYRRASTHNERSVVAIVSSATILGLIPLLLLVFLPIASGVDEIVRPDIAALGLLAIPTGFAYSIFQYQMLGIRRLVQRGAVYVILSGLLLVVMILLVGIGITIKPDLFESRRNDLLITSGAVVFGALAFAYLRPILQRLADTYVYRDVFDYREAIVELSKEAQRARQPKDVVVSMLEQVKAIARLEGYLVVTGRSQSASEIISGGMSAQRLRRAYDSPGFLPSRGSSIRQLESDPVLAFVLDEDTALLLGPKSGGEAFRDDDVKLMEPMATLVSMLLARSKLSDELRDLNGRLMTAQEEERARLAIDLHDGPLQQAIFLSRTAVPSDKVIDVGKSLVTELRAITNALRPPMLDDLGLRYAIDWLARNLPGKEAVHITMDLDGFPDETRLPAASEMAIYRCAQEALNNVVKHSGATQATISLRIAQGKAILSIMDNGRGFGAAERERAAKDGHLGLLGMRERVRHAGGTLAIESAPGQGATITISVPVEADSALPEAARSV